MFSIIFELLAIILDIIASILEMFFKKYNYPAQALTMCILSVALSMFVIINLGLKGRSWTSKEYAFTTILMLLDVVIKAVNQFLK